ncbi:hypothetical protein DFH11DRAFT_1745560 [Phellopilus nigrolimitatus]|nr:hypothetical protein DFH11DRAFT_1745560 [Phellopilus nigrolimitatus]
MLIGWRKFGVWRSGRTYGCENQGNLVCQLHKMSDGKARYKAREGTERADEGSVWNTSATFPLRAAIIHLFGMRCAPSGLNFGEAKALVQRVHRRSRSENRPFLRCSESQARAQWQIHGRRGYNKSISGKRDSRRQSETAQAPQRTGGSTSTFHGMEYVHADDQLGVAVKAENIVKNHSGRVSEDATPSLRDDSLPDLQLCRSPQTTTKLTNEITLRNSVDALSKTESSSSTASRHTSNPISPSRSNPKNAIARDLHNPPPVDVGMRASGRYVEISGNCFGDTDKSGRLNAFQCGKKSATVCCFECVKKGHVYKPTLPLETEKQQATFRFTCIRRLMYEAGMRKDSDGKFFTCVQRGMVLAANN